MTAGGVKGQPQAERGHVAQRSPATTLDATSGCATSREGQPHRKVGHAYSGYDAPRSDTQGRATKERERG